MIFMDRKFPLDEALSHIVATRPNMRLSRYLARWRMNNSARLDQISAAINIDGIGQDKARAGIVRAALLASIVASDSWSPHQLKCYAQALALSAQPQIRIEILKQIEQFPYFPPRTRAKCLTQGFGLHSCVDTYVQEVCKLFKKWGSYGQDWTGRRDAMFKLAQETLQSAGVPLPKFKGMQVEITLDQDLGLIPTQTLGEFHRVPWELKVNTLAFRFDAKADEVFANRFARLANAVFHEARHCEQTFLALRYAAGGFNTSAHAISRKTSVHFPTAMAAWGAPLAGDYPGLPVISEWYETIFGEDPTLDTSRESTNRVEHEAGRKRDAGDPTQQGEALAAQQAYLDLPVECDAHALGDAVEHKVLAAIRPSARRAGAA